MAIKCPNCGQVLPKDNAKFCNSCGAALRSLPQNSQQGITEGPLRFPTRPGLYEQIAQQPPARPPGANRSLPTEPPSWMRTLDRGVDPRFIEGAGDPPQQDEATQRVPYSRNRGLHAKVWENKEPDYASRGQEFPTFSEEDTISPDESPVFEGSVEDLPTAHVEATIPKPPLQRSPGMQPKGVVFQKPPSTPQLGARELQDFPQVGGINRTPRPPFQAMADQSTMGTMHQPPQEGGRAGFGPQSGAPMSIVTKPVSRQGMSRKRLAVVLALVIVLVVGGIAAWIIAARPFAVASITQPWQQFCDSGLGVSGQYPTGWTKQVDASKEVHFSDGTDQFSIVVVAANGQDAVTYLREEAAQHGITGLKLGPPISFAGTSWQQGQGSLLQAGVTYTETLLVTSHNNQFFTVMQIAPPGTYNEEDATIFSGMRSSFQFSTSCP